MASELDGIEGITFTDESLVRRQVAAQLFATGHKDALADKARLDKIAAALSNEEKVAHALKQKDPLPVAEKVLLNQAIANTQRLIKLFQSTQKEVDARTEQRRVRELARLNMEAAKEAKVLAARQEQFRRDNAAQDAVVAAGGTRQQYQRTTHDDDLDELFGAEVKQEGGASPSQGWAAPSIAGRSADSQQQQANVGMLGNPLRTFIKPALTSQAMNSARAIGASNAASAKAALIGSGTKRRSGTSGTAAIEEYTGGDLLPSVNQVSVSRSELKHFREHGRALKQGEVREEDNDSDVEVLEGPTRTLGSGGTTGTQQKQAPVPQGPWTPMSAPAEHLDDGSDMLFRARLGRLQQRKAAHKRARERERRVKAEEGTQEADDQRRAQEEDEDDDDVFVELFHGQQLYLHQNVFDALLDYQQKGVQWLLQHHLRGEGCILGDEMGLGKTVQISAMLNALHTSERLIGPVLIACPLTVMNQWVSELHRWAPNMRVAKFHSSSSNDGPRDKVLKEVYRTPSVVVTTYQSMAANVEELLKVQFQYVILDEGHKICNPNSAITIAAKTFATPHRILMTGSPIQNTLKELWCLFDFCRKGLLGTQSRFVEEFERPINYSRNPKATPLEQATAVQCAVALREHIAPFLLRRLKKDVNARLPAKHERVIRCALTDSQLDMYVNFLMTKEVQGLLQSCSDNRLNQVFKDGGAGFLKDGTFVSKSGKGGGLVEKDYYRAYHILSQLRLLCSHADIFRLKLEDTAEGGSGKNISFRSNNPVDYSGSCKLDALRRLMVTWKAGGHKVLIFSQWVMALDIIENCVEQEGYKYVRVDGKTPADHRSVLLDKFNDDPSIFCALLTTRVGGLGLNLTGADRVVLFDPDWNPKVDEQARERAWRIGQKREVCVYRMITSGTIEEHILHRQLAKSYVTDKVLENPQLQQVFAVMSLIDGFYLSSQYADRVASNVRPLVCSMQMDLLEEEDDAEVAREDARDNANANVSQQQLNMPTSPTMSAPSTSSVKVEGGQQTKVKVEVKREPGSGGGSGARSSAAAAAASSDDGRHEMGMLSDILDSASTRVGRFGAPTSQQDAVTSRLAALAAAGIMQRITDSGNNTTQQSQQRSNTMPSRSQSYGGGRY